jgi:hypothetical protein
MVLFSCASVFKPELGMTEKHWLRTTLIADLAYMEGDVTAWKSNGVYYYFSDGVLVKIDQGMLPAQQINMDLKTASAYDSIYDELKKLDELRVSGVITQAEFEEQKKIILDKNK